MTLTLFIEMVDFEIDEGKVVSTPTATPLEVGRPQDLLERPGPPPKRKHPDSTHPSFLESSSKRPKVTPSQSHVSSGQVPTQSLQTSSKMARVQHPPKQRNESPKLPKTQQKPAKSSFSHSNALAAPQKTSFFGASTQQSPNQPSKPSASKIKTTDQLFASLIGSKKKK
jgi:hypothetical protein